MPNKDSHNNSKRAFFSNLSGVVSSACMMFTSDCFLFLGSTARLGHPLFWHFYASTDTYNERTNCKFQMSFRNMQFSIGLKHRSQLLSSKVRFTFRNLSVCRGKPSFLVSRRDLLSSFLTNWKLSCLLGQFRPSRSGF